MTDLNLNDLNEREIAILNFEQHWVGRNAAKEQAIRSQFGFSAVRYYQILGELIQQPAALRYDPVMVNRLLRLARERSHLRASRMLRRSEHD